MVSDHEFRAGAVVLFQEKTKPECIFIAEDKRSDIFGHPNAFLAKSILSPSGVVQDFSDSRADFICGDRSAGGLLAMRNECFRDIKQSGLIIAVVRVPHAMAKQLIVTHAGWN
jgi:hypothetical protein